MKFIYWLGGLLVLGFSVSCMVEVDDFDGLETEEAPLVVEDDRHWHQRWVEDSCARCPECCVVTTENGFIDEYGVERPLDWLPDDGEFPVDTAELEENCAQELLFESEEFCQNCLGDDCLCLIDGNGNWWMDATLGDE